MSSILTNKYTPSELISLDIMNLLGEMDSVFLKYTGTHGMSTFRDEDYVPGMTVGYQVSGIPPVTRSDKMYFTEYEQRTLHIKADNERWMKSVTSSFNLTDDIFFMKPQLVTETISAPTLRALKENWELEAAEYAIEHSPIIPTFGAAINEEISFPTDSGGKNSFTFKAINWLKKLRYDLQLPLKSYNLVLNTMDYMTLANSLENIFNQPFTSLVVKSGAPPSQVSDFPNECSPYLGRHDIAKEDQPRGGLYFVSLPTSDETPTCVIRNTNAPVGAGGEDDENAIWLKAGDIIYYKAATANPTNGGLYWIQNTVKRAVPDSRYAFVVTSDQYIQDMKSNGESLKDFQYSDVIYKIPPGEQITLSVSHRPIPSGYHQNVSRQIATFSGSDVAPVGDEFYLLDSHYKNVAVNPNYFMMKSFKIPHMKSTQYSYVDDKKTGIKMLVTQDRVFSEGARRGNVFDTTSLCCFGAVAQNLFTLPSGVDR